MLKRFYIRHLLAVVAVVAVATHWWMTLPDRTVQRYAEALVSKDTDAATRLCPSVNIVAEHGLLATDLTYNIVPKRRNLKQMLLGRASYSIDLSAAGRECLALTTDVSGGEVVKVTDPVRSFSFFVGATNR